MKYLKTKSDMASFLERTCHFVFVLLSAIAASEDADDLCSRTFNFTDGGYTCCGLWANLGGGTEIAAPQMGTLCFLWLQCFAHDMGNGVKCGIFRTKIDVQ